MKNIVQEMHQPGKLCTGFNSIGHRNPIITEKSKGLQFNESARIYSP